MDTIVKIIMKRDDISENEAWNLVEECRAELQDLIAHADIYPSLSLYEAATDILNDYLSLEPDYLEFLI